MPNQGLTVIGVRVAATATPTRRRAKQQEPASEVRVINGVAVLSAEPVLSNLPTRPPTKVIELKMADGNVFFGCAECDEVGPSRGELQKHRAEVHGPGWPGYAHNRAARQNVSAAQETTTAMLGMTLAEVVEMAMQAAQWSSLHARQEAQIEQWRDRALTAERIMRQYETTFRRLGFVPRDEAE